MQVPFTVVFEPPSRAEVRTLSRSWRFWVRSTVVLVIAAAPLAVMFVGYHLVKQHQIQVATAAVTITSAPAGAVVDLDGSQRGQTPLTVAVIPGSHRVALHLDGYAGSTSMVSPADGQSVQVHTTLWLAQPQLTQIRSPLPGAAIANAQFLKDGQIALTATLPPSPERQLWVLDERGPRRLGPTGINGPLAIEGNGQRIAYAAAAAGSASTASLSQLWVTNTRGDAPRPVSSGSDNGQPEQIADISWAPNGTHLLVASQRQLTDGGGTRTRLLWVPVDGGEPRELAALPSQVIPGSYVWGSSSRVAFLVKSGSVASLCLLDTASGRLRNVTDLAGDAGSSTLFAPVAWTADGGRVAYSGPGLIALNQVDRLFGGQAHTALFTTDPDATSSQQVTVFDAQDPTWRDDGSLVVLGKPRKGPGVAAYVLGSSGPLQPLATMPLTGQLAGVRWDADRSAALIALRDSSQLADSQLNYWLVRFSPGGPQ